MERFRERDKWGAGPWDQEPDQELLVTEAGLPGLLYRNHYGAWCGYVGVEKSHPCFGLGFGQLENIDVHGGLTFSNFRAYDPTDLQASITNEEIWWFGFDCNHAFDFTPGLNRRLFEHLVIGKNRLDSRYAERYRTYEYAKGQVERLAVQLQERMVEFLYPMFAPHLDKPNQT